MLLLYCLALALISGSQALTVDQAPYNTSAVIGGNATLTCSVSNKQSSENVKWYAAGSSSAVTVNDVLTDSSGHFAISGTYNLVIINVTSDDEGQYTCEAATTNYYGSLTAVDLPSNLTVYWASSPAASSTVNLTCYATRGHPPATLSWYKNDVALDSSSAVYTGTADSSGYGEAFSILPVSLTSNDEGAVFRCEASYPDYDNALNANITTTFNAQSGTGGLEGCESVCARSSQLQQTWRQKLTPTLAYWFYSSCGIQSCPDFDAFAAGLATLVTQEFCPED